MIVIEGNFLNASYANYSQHITKIALSVPLITNLINAINTCYSKFSVKRDNYTARLIRFALATIRQLARWQGHPFCPGHRLCTLTEWRPPMHPCFPRYLLSAYTNIPLVNNRITQVKTSTQLTIEYYTHDNKKMSEKKRTKYCGPATVSMQNPPPGGRLRSAVGARHKMSSISILKADSLGAKLFTVLLSEVTVLERLE